MHAAILVIRATFAADLDARIDTRILFDLEGQDEITVFGFRTQEGVLSIAHGRADDDTILQLVAGGTAALLPLR